MTRESFTPSPMKVKFFELVKNPDFLAKTREEQAKELDVSAWTVTQWCKEVDWDAVREEIRRGYARYAPLVDMALIRRAMKGSEKAAELFYQRLEGWNLKHSLEVSRRGTMEIDDQTMFEAMKDLFRSLPPEKRAEVIAYGGNAALPEAVPALDQGRNENISREFHGEGNTSPTENHA